MSTIFKIKHGNTAPGVKDLEPNELGLSEGKNLYAGQSGNLPPKLLNPEYKTNIIVEYAVSTNNNINSPPSVWSKTIPEFGNNSYLWNRITYKLYSNNNPGVDEYYYSITPISSKVLTNQLTAGTGITIDSNNKINNSGVRSVTKPKDSDGVIAVNTNGTTTNIQVINPNSRAKQVTLTGMSDGSGTVDSNGNITIVANNRSTIVGQMANADASLKAPWFKFAELNAGYTNTFNQDACFLVERLYNDWPKKSDTTEGLGFYTGEAGILRAFVRGWKGETNTGDYLQQHFLQWIYATTAIKFNNFVLAYSKDAPATAELWLKTNEPWVSYRITLLDESTNDNYYHNYFINTQSQWKLMPITLSTNSNIKGVETITSLPEQVSSSALPIHGAITPSNVILVSESRNITPEDFGRTLKITQNNVILTVPDDLISDNIILKYGYWEIAVVMWQAKNNTVTIAQTSDSDKYFVFNGTAVKKRKATMIGGWGTMVSLKLMTGSSLLVNGNCTVSSL